MGLLVRLSSLVQEERAWRGGLDDALREVHRGLAGRLSTARTLDLRIATDGALALAGEHLPAGRAGSGRLGRALCDAGVRCVRFHQGVEALELARFLSALSLFAGSLLTDEHDLVTFWAEQGVPRIEIVETTLISAALLSARALSDSSLALLVDTLFAAPAALAAAARLPDDGVVMAHVAPPVQVRVDLAQRFGHELTDESVPAVRRAVLHSALAALGAHQPALGDGELASVLLRLLRDALRGAEFELVGATVEHLERLADPTALLRPRVHAIASRVLERMRSVDWLVDLIDACVGATRLERLDGLLAWMLRREPQRLLHAALSRLDPSQTSYAVAVLAAHFGTRDPFWQATLSSVALSHRQRTAVLRALSSLESELGLDATRAPTLARGLSSPGLTQPSVSLPRDTRQLHAVRPGDALALDETLPPRLADDEGGDDLLDDPRFVEDLDGALLDLIRRRSAFAGEPRVD